MLKRQSIAALSLVVGLAGGATATAQTNLVAFHPDTAASASAQADFDQGYLAFERNDFRDALQLFKAAASRGNRNAEEFLALMYLSGERVYPNVPQNNQEAVAWLERAAVRGSDVAARTLGILRQSNDTYARYYLGSVLMP